MKDLQQVIERAKADIAKQYVFVHMPIPQLETLLAGFEGLQRENTAMKEALSLIANDDSFTSFNARNRAQKLLYGAKPICID